MFYDSSDYTTKNIAGIIANSDLLCNIMYAFSESEHTEHSNSDFDELFEQIILELQDNNCWGYYSDGVTELKDCAFGVQTFNGEIIKTDSNGNPLDTMMNAVNHYTDILLAVLKSNIAYLHNLLHMDNDGQESFCETPEQNLELTTNAFDLTFKHENCNEIDNTIPLIIRDDFNFNYTNIAVIKKEDYEKERAKLSHIIGAKNNAYNQYAKESKIFDDFCELIVCDMQQYTDRFHRGDTKINMVRTIFFAIDTENPEKSIVDCITIYGNDILMPIIKSKQNEMLDKKLKAIRDAFMDDYEIS